MLESAVDGLGGIDVLVNNAGIQISSPSHELSTSDFDKVLAVNLRGAFLCAREAVKRFLAARTHGVIINVSSVHQLIPKPNYLASQDTAYITGQTIFVDGGLALFADFREPWSSE